MIQNGKGRNIRLDVSIAQNTLPSLQYLRKHFGGNIYGSEPKDPTKRICYQLRINGEKAATFLIGVLPYLIVKLKDVEEVLTIWNIRKSDNDLARDLVNKRRQRRQEERNARYGIRNSSDSSGIPF